LGAWKLNLPTQLTSADFRRTLKVSLPAESWNARIDGSKQHALLLPANLNLPDGSYEMIPGDKPTQNW